MSESLGHWAEKLEPGDRCLATIRHKTDGAMNLNNIKVIVVENNPHESSIICTGFFSKDKSIVKYNDLRELKKTGIELIAIERQEQLGKHHYSIQQDIIYNSGIEKPLTKAASALTVEYGNALAMEAMKPFNWDQEIWENMMVKPYKERLIIAGALIAAEIDRLQNI